MTTDTAKLTETSTQDIDPDTLEVIESLFFAYRDFVGDPDAILATYGFGRAHHRVLHFVNRNPGIRVTDLLDILLITKQSLGRVLRQLIETGFIDQQRGSDDLRQRLLFPTASGQELAKRLWSPQATRIETALAQLDEDGARAARKFLALMRNPE